MTKNTNNKYALCSKKVWAIYALITVAIMIILATFVAQDNEERLFYSLMTAAASYVFRPTDKIISKYVLRLFGVSPPEESDVND
ncbi:MAG: hypothetical protein U9N57_12390 [Pseudomonadota bacterium]|nr:hypothetical protein [Pseudomonadota bacterium]